MPSLYERYLAGEHAAVWTELGTGLPLPVDRAEAEAIARETMRRVRHNVDVLVSRLVAAGYPFAHPVSPSGDDLSARYHAVLAPPTPQTPAVLDEIERLVGPLPLSVRAWYEHVGAVNFDGAEPEVMCDYDDPLMVGPEEYTLKNAREWLALPAQERDEYPFCWEFAPDVLHKANVSGGSPFRIQLPAPGADGMVEEEAWGTIPFVSYLREVFRWGGFPGVRYLAPDHPRRQEVARLCAGLMSF